MSPTTRDSIHLWTVFKTMPNHRIVPTYTTYMTSNKHGKPMIARACPRQHAQIAAPTTRFPQEHTQNPITCLGGIVRGRRRARRDFWGHYESRVPSRFLSNAGKTLYARPHKGPCVDIFVCGLLFLHNIFIFSTRFQLLMPNNDAPSDS